MHAGCSQTLVMEPNRMLVAGDEPALCRYDFSGHLVSKSITSLACAYGLARSHKTGVVAMAGCAGKLHVFGDGGSHLGGLR